MGKTNDLVFIFEYHSQLTDAERYRLLTLDGQKENDASSYRLTKSSKNLKAWVKDDRFFTSLDPTFWPRWFVQNMHCNASTPKAQKYQKRYFCQKIVH